MLHYREDLCSASPCQLMFPFGVQSWHSWGSDVGNWRQPGHPQTQMQSGVLVLLAPRTDLWVVADTVATDLLALSLAENLYYILNYFIHFYLFLPVFMVFSPTVSFSWGRRALHLASCCFLTLGSIDPALTPSHHFLGQAPAPRGACRQQQVAGGGSWDADPPECWSSGCWSPPGLGLGMLLPPALARTACVCYGRAGSQPVPGRQPALWVQYVQ